MSMQVLDKWKAHADRIAELERKNVFLGDANMELLDRSKAAEIRAEAAERERDEAHHEASCCDDINLDQTLAGIISDLQRAREKAERERDALREALTLIMERCQSRQVWRSFCESIARAALEAKP